MAESVARVKILAQIEGLEGFDKLKGAFKGLQQAIGPADADLSKARKEILEFGKAGAKTEQVIRGQVDALKALQGQASISGSVYRKLSQDIKALDNTYKEATKSAAEFRAEQAKVRNQIPAAKERTLANQLAPFKAELQEASVYARRYGELLAEIERQQKPFDRASDGAAASAAGIARPARHDRRPEPAPERAQRRFCQSRPRWRPLDPGLSRDR